MNKLRIVINDFQPDVIVSTRQKLTGGVAQASGHIPFIFESHSSYKGALLIENNFYGRLKNYFGCRSVKLANRVVALTDGDAQEWRKLNPRVSVIPNSVHLYEGADFSRCDVKSVIFVGRLTNQKGFKSLLNIWRIVYERHPDWQLQIYGGYGENSDVILPMIENSKMNIHVFQPTLDIMDRYIQNSILVMTSVYEPFGLVLPEAMSCGLPVVAFDCPYGPADIITDGKDGFLIHNRNHQQFAEKVCLLIDNYELRLKMGKEGILSSQRYKAEVIMPQWETLFEEVVACRTF